jgi:L-2-hydroxyglutarate oxidase LhgO
MWKSVLVDQASSLLYGVSREQFTKWGAPGIRAQLYDTQEKRLIMDFCTQGDDGSFHVLNAVSPAFTSSMPFAAYCCDQILQKVNKNKSGEFDGTQG